MITLKTNTVLTFLLSTSPFLLKHVHPILHPRIKKTGLPFFSIFFIHPKENLGILFVLVLYSFV